MPISATFITQFNINEIVDRLYNFDNQGIEVHYIKEEVFNDEQTVAEETRESNEISHFDDGSMYAIGANNSLQESTQMENRFENSYHPDQVDTDTTGQESVTQYEEVFVQESPDLDNDENDQQIVSYVNHTTEEISNSESELYHNQNSANMNVNNGEDDSDNDDYQIVEGLHITGDVEDQVDHDDVSANTKSKAESVLKSACITNSVRGMEKKDVKTVLYYVVRRPEKENMNSLSLSNPVLYKPAKVNPRSLLKSSHMEQGSIQQENLQVERPNKRFARSKEAIEERLFMNFINRTTIPVEPIRNHRLPRKQKIKPIKRMDDEEIVVQEVVVSSNGFVETLEDGVLKSKEPLKVTETVTLTDSDDDYDPKEAKKKKHRCRKQKHRARSDSTDSEESIIEILSDDDDEQPRELDKCNSAPKKGRGRPKKASDEKRDNDANIMDDGKSAKRGRGRPPKVSRVNKNEDDDSESPAKKSKTDESEDSPPAKSENKCPECTKIFASPNSLRTHLQHHNLENSLKNSEAAKEAITDIQVVESNSKTDSVASRNDEILPPEKLSTEETIPNIDAENPKDEDGSTHIKTLIKDVAETSNTKSKLPPRGATRSQMGRNTRSEIVYKHKCSNCDAAFKNEILLKRHVCMKKPMASKLECSICKKHFSDIAMLNIHKKSHAKTNLIKSTAVVKVSPRISRTSSVTSTLKSSNKYGSQKCNECGKVCSSLIILNAHMKSHKQFSCNTCKTSFPSRILLDTHVRENCVKTKSPQNKRLSFKIKRSFVPSPKRISSRLPIRGLGKRSSVSTKSNSSISTSDTTISRASIKVFQLQCDSCNMKFSSHQNLFDHKVLKHGLNTPDKRNILERSNKKKASFKERGTFGGIPASAKLTSAYVALRNKFDNLG